MTIDEIRARAAAASPGPWEVYDPNEGSSHGPLWSVANDAFHNPSGDDEDTAFNAYVDCGDKSDAEFIAAARQDIDDLLAVVDRLLQMTDLPAGSKPTPDLIYFADRCRWVLAGSPLADAEVTA